MEFYQTASNHENDDTSKDYLSTTNTGYNKNGCFLVIGEQNFTKSTGKFLNHGGGLVDIDKLQNSSSFTGRLKIKQGSDNAYSALGFASIINKEFSGSSNYSYYV